MASMIKKTAVQSFPKRKPPKSADYLAFIRKLPCIVMRRPGNIEACHLSYANRDFGHYGRARGTRAPDRWALPMSKSLHDEQHSGSEEMFWMKQRINPHLAAVILWGVFTELGDDGVEEATAIIMANRFDR